MQRWSWPPVKSKGDHILVMATPGTNLNDSQKPDVKFHENDSLYSWWLVLQSIRSRVIKSSPQVEVGSENQNDSSLVIWLTLGSTNTGVRAQIFAALLIPLHFSFQVNTTFYEHPVSFGWRDKLEKLSRFQSRKWFSFQNQSLLLDTTRAFPGDKYVHLLAFPEQRCDTIFHASGWPSMRTRNPTIRVGQYTPDRT